MSLVRSKARVAEHGEVFTPAATVEDMLDLVKEQTERIDARFLEPACGSGNFLVQVLRRKLKAVDDKYRGSDFERRHYGLFGLMCIYGVDILEDNVQECRGNLREIFCEHVSCRTDDEFGMAARHVLAQNILHGDALKMITSAGLPLTFAEWGYLGKGRFQRRDFRLDTLTQMSSFGDDTLFADLGKHEIFTPVKEYAPATALELAHE